MENRERWETSGDDTRTEMVRRVCQYIDDRPGSAPTLAELQDHCRGRLAGYKLPRGLRLVERVARTEAGKPDYPRLRAGLAEPR